MIYIPYVNSFTYHAASIRKSPTNKCQHLNIGSGVILRTFGHDPVLRVFALCTSLRPAPICVRFTARVQTRATLFRRVDVSNSVSSSTRHYPRHVKALLGGFCVSGGSDEIHSGHPWPSPCGQLRCAHLSGPHSRAGARRRAAVPRKTPSRPADVSNSMSPSTRHFRQIRKSPRSGALAYLAEAVRFELTVGSHPRQFSRLLP